MSRSPIYIMAKKEMIKTQLNLFSDWIKRNSTKILFILLVHFILQQILSLPYINIATIYFSYILYIIDWFLIVILLKPNKNILLYCALSLFVVCFFLALVNQALLLERFGEIIYFLIGTYLLQSLFAKEK